MNGRPKRPGFRPGLNQKWLIAGIAAGFILLSVTALAVGLMLMPPPDESGENIQAFAAGGNKAIQLESRSSNLIGFAEMSEKIGDNFGELVDLQLTVLDDMPVYQASVINRRIMSRVVFDAATGDIRGE